MQPYLTAALNELVTLATQSADCVLELVLDVMLTAIRVCLIPLCVVLFT